MAKARQASKTNANSQRKDYALLINFLNFKKLILEIVYDKFKKTVLKLF